MAIRNIVQFGEEVLQKKSRVVENFDDRLHLLIDDMIETLHSTEGVGLASPQVGVLKRVCLVEVDELIELVNPEIIEQEGLQDGAEGCLSNPGQYGMVERPNYVKVKAQDRNGNFFEVEATEFEARAFCHEIDHLNGIVFTDKASRMLSEDELRHSDDEEE